MMLGHNPTVQIPPWSEDPTAGDYSPMSLREAISALQRCLPARDADETDLEQEMDFTAARESDAPVDAYSCDHFRMFEFKIRRCPRGRSHDWTECPYAHPGEKARRRDPRRFHYSGTACAEFRKGSCRRGESCEFAHGVFECWLHPARYRTQPCKDGPNCPRRVCFFAHAPEELRVLPAQSPRSVNSADSDSPPMSPMNQAHQTLSRSLGSGSGSSSINEMVASLRNLQLGKVQPLPSAWNVPVGSPVFGSPLRPAFLSLPTTPISTRRSAPPMDFWDTVCEEEEPAMERVESGRDLRVRMFEKLSKENPLEQPDPAQSAGVPDLGWISELVK